MSVFQGVSISVRSLFAFAGLVLLTASGCIGGLEGDKFKGERGSVSGKITYKGAPIPAGSSVIFQAAAGYTGVGKTNDEGEYTLSYNKTSTLPAVSYTVQVSVPAAAAPAKMDPANMGVETAPAPPPFPARYSAGTTSGLEFTVKGGVNRADFDLKD